MSEHQQIHWRYATAETLDRLCNCAPAEWLTLAERDELARWHDTRRRQSWLRGRMLAKQLIAAVGGAKPANREPGTTVLENSDIEILSRDAAGRVNRPLVACQGRPRECSLSISHTTRGVLVAYSLQRAVCLGVDAALCGEVPPSVIRSWFTTAEQEWLARSQSAPIGCFVWAAKEALYKACNRGEGFDPRAVEILPHARATYRGQPLPGLRLRSRLIDGHIAVMAAISTN